MVEYTPTFAMSVLSMNRMQLPEIEWQPVSRAQFVGWTIFYVLLLFYLTANWGQMTLLDNIHLPIHEGGHLLFGWLGETLGLWGSVHKQLWMLTKDRSDLDEAVRAARCAPFAALILSVAVFTLLEKP